MSRSEKANILVVVVFLAEQLRRTSVLVVVGPPEVRQMLFPVDGLGWLPVQQQQQYLAGPY